MMQVEHEPRSWVPSLAIVAERALPPNWGSASRRTLGVHPRWRTIRVLAARKAKEVVLSSEAAPCPFSRCKSTEVWTNSPPFLPRRQVGQPSDLMSFFPAIKWALGSSAKTRGDEATTRMLGRRWRVILTLRPLPRHLAGAKGRSANSTNYPRVTVEQMCRHSLFLLELAYVLKIPAILLIATCHKGWRNYANVKSDRPALFCSTVTLYRCVKTPGHLGSHSACIFSFWSVLAKGFRMDKASPPFESVGGPSEGARFPAWVARKAAV